jgi:hypothetical protein
MKMSGTTEQKEAADVGGSLLEAQYAQDWAWNYIDIGAEVVEN